MTQKSCAVGMRNAKLGNHLKKNFSEMNFLVELKINSVVKKKAIKAKKSAFDFYIIRF